jgi:hypothetical protein
MSIINYTNSSLKFEDAFEAIYNGLNIEFYGSNNKYPEKNGFTYTVKKQKQLCKLFSKINKKFSTIEIKIIFSDNTKKFLTFLVENNFENNFEFESEFFKQFSILQVKFEMINNLKLNQDEILSKFFINII